ncbi:MAG: hypothetical protein RL755_979 [Pseudomonadota bacterium]
MAKSALTIGAYQARSVIASAQRCVNLYLEANPQGSVFPFTHYPTPGLTLKSNVPAISWRGLYSASNNQLYGVCGNIVYAISSSFVCTVIGTITSYAGPVSMVDNTVDLILVEGFRSEAFAKIELHRPSLKQVLLYPNDSNIIALASDSVIDVPANLPLLDLNQPAEIAAFILHTFLKL